MKYSILGRLALKTLHSYRNVFFPFCLALTVLFSIEYIMLSVFQNDYLQTYSQSLVQIAGIGLFFVTILVIAISIYTSSFVRKNLSKEYGLFHVLGLEKKHLIFISTLQLLLVFIFVAIFAILLGYTSGHFIFKALNLALKNTGTDLMDYPFLPGVALQTLIVMMISFAAIFITWIWQILRLNSINLLKANRKGQGQVKSRWLLMTLGLVCIAIAYYIALTTTSVRAALIEVFIAIALAVVGTYCLFLSLISIVMKGIQKSRAYYQKPNLFISTAGMLQRIRYSALSLASITILISGIILVMSMTLTVYTNLEYAINKTVPKDFKVNIYSLSDESRQDMVDNIIAEVDQIADLDQVSQTKDFTSSASLKGHSLEALVPNQQPQGTPVFLIMESQESYGALFDMDRAIEEDEVIISSNLINIDKLETIHIDNKLFKTIPGKSEALPGNLAVEALYLAFANDEILEEANQAFPVYDFQGNLMENVYNYNLHFDVAEGQEQDVNDLLTQLRDNPSRLGDGSMNFISQSLTGRFFYETYGGLVFIGAVVSIVLLTGTLLMLYFKQIEEGKMDQGKFDIMKKVGLPHPLIKRTIASQLIWIFALPVIVAVIHNLVASKIAFKLLGLVGVSQPWMYMASLLGVTLVFVLIYLLAYWTSSRAYYAIVNPS